MKKILLYIGLALAAIGCTKDPDIEPLGDNVLMITSKINSRVANEQWEKNDTIGVYMTVSDFGDNGANVEYVTTDGSGDFSSATPLYYPTSEEVEIFAYYPWVDGVDLTAYSINSEDQVDLLSATKSNLTISPTAVVLSFSHLLSKVSLTIQAGDGLTTADLADLVVKISGVSTTVDFNILDPTESILTNTDSELTLNTVITKNSDATAITAVSSSVIIIPQSSKGATLNFTTNDYGTFSATISTEKFEVGKEYKYTATLNRNGVALSEANIDDWNKNTDSGTADIVDIEYKSGKYYINSAKGLAAFSDLVYGAGSNTKGATFAGFTEDEFTSDHTDIDGVLTRDIDLIDVCYNGANWNPIGRNYSGSPYYYQGTFDGGGYTVSNLYINATSQQALFGYVDKGGVVCNLGVSGQVTGCASGEAFQTAGIVANNYGNIFNCFSEVNVTGDTNVGGIAGLNEGYVVNCYNRGTVEGIVDNIGGIVGQNVDGGYIGYCYSTGTILPERDGSNGSLKIGGVVGWNHTTTTDDPTVKGSFCLDNTTYSIGLTGYTASSGGLTGNVCTEEYLKSAIFATVINNGAYTYNNPELGVTTKVCEVCAWKDNSSTNYPTLNFGNTPTSLWIYDIIYYNGVYDIYTAAGLKGFADLVNGEYVDNQEEIVTSGGDTYFKALENSAQSDITGFLMSNIDLGELDDDWTPIGISSNAPYSGTFDGNGKLVSNLSVSDNLEYIGLFGYTNSSSDISNLGVSGSVISVSGYAGGVVGWNYGYITNCYNNSQVNGGYVGGVVGWNNGYIANCYNTGKVEGSTYTGGVVGYNYIDGYITNCYNAYNNGNVVGTNENTNSDTYCYYLANETDSSTGAMSSELMQAESFVSTLNGNAYTYNNSSPTPSLAACAWLLNSSGTPTLDFGADPSTAYWTLSNISADSYPIEDTWYLIDSEIGDITNLEAALSAATAAGKSITVVFSNCETVAEKAFFESSNLTSISLPNATTIGDLAFFACYELVSASLPNAITIGNSAFGGCYNLTSIELPLAESIVDNAFSSCLKLSSIELPLATSIGGYAFAGCSNFTSIELPLATSIGYGVFFNCGNLTSVSLPSATTIGGSVFSYCFNLTSVSLPSAMTIGDSAFYECTLLTTLDFGSTGSGITSIGSDAFESVTTENVDLTIKIADGVSDISVNGYVLEYSDKSTTFHSITEVTPLINTEND